MLVTLGLPVIVAAAVCWLAVVADAQTVRNFGVYRGAAPYGARNMPAYEQWINRNVVIGLDFEATDSWTNVEGPGWQLPSWATWVKNDTTKQRRLALSIPMFPSTITNTTFAFQQGAAGAYNASFFRLGRNLHNAGLNTSILRIAWEFNGGWYPWTPRSNNDAEWILFWRNIVENIRLGAPGNNFTFCLCYAVSNAGGLWPGDDWVDWVGIDVYDADWSDYPVNANRGAWNSLIKYNPTDLVSWGGYVWITSTTVNGTANEPCLNATAAHPSVWSVYMTPAQWQTKVTAAWNFLRTGYYAINFYQNIAIAHNKPLCFPEWGVWDGSHKWGDNPYYIQKMYDFITNPANNVIWSSYFDVYAHDGNHELIPSATNPAQFPASASLYRKLFGGPNPPPDYVAPSALVCGTSRPSSSSSSGSGRSSSSSSAAALLSSSSSVARSCSSSSIAPPLSSSSSSDARPSSSSSSMARSSSSASASALPPSSSSAPDVRSSSSSSGSSTATGSSSGSDGLELDTSSSSGSVADTTSSGSDLSGSALSCFVF